MNFLKKVFASAEVKAALGVLDEAAHRYQHLQFQMIKEVIERFLLTRSADFIRVLNESGGRSPREWVYSQIWNMAGDMLESGRYHIYRGILDPMGENLLRIFDGATEQLIQMKAVDPEYAKEQKEILSTCIARMG
ncbi:MAG TPA: hypothetical protein VK395_19610 [Gemmataceae bacterium]|nr:hypothetical protein [Gemmataceae bacterium]